MVLDSPLADAQVSRNVLAWLPRKDELHDLLLSRREAREVGKGSVAR